MPAVVIAIIGCGRVAGHHCSFIRDMEGLELAAVCDLAEDRAAAFGAEYSAPYYTNYHDMFAAHPEISVVAIVTPSGMHFEHAMAVMERYKKHIIVEKPTFMRPEQLIAAYATADKLGLRIFPVFQNRMNKAVRRVRAALDAGELGDIRLVGVRVRWCRPQRYYDLAPWRGTLTHDGGALTNQGIHHVDLLRYLGGPVETVSATMATMGVDIEAEDAVVATLGYVNGAIGSLEVTTAARPDDFEASISLVGSEGMAQIGGVAVNELQIFTPDPAACAANSEDFLGIKGKGAVYGYGHGEMYASIADHFISGAPFLVDRDDCLATIRLLHAFYRSDETGVRVRVDSDEQSSRLGGDNDAISDLYRTPEPATGA
ncbi:MAG: Gfo/Idh/MocA family oxidoreductase [Rhodospirillales bacterium]|nr:Gfo/Idh/MocA family oxidoreductase [Rhodospirillales bacterium]